MSRSLICEFINTIRFHGVYKGVYRVYRGLHPTSTGLNFRGKTRFGLSPVLNGLRLVVYGESV